MATFTTSNLTFTTPLATSTSYYRMPYTYTMPYKSRWHIKKRFLTNGIKHCHPLTNIFV